jgi:vacuolar-type H+-ATPase subunit B/Vma2
MTEPPDTLTPAQVGRFLMGLARRLDELVVEFKELGARSAEAKRDAAKAQAHAYIASAPGPDSPKRTVAEREALTTLAAADALFTADLAKAQVDACREAIRALHARLDVGRTLSATSREEMRMSGGQT